MMEQLPKLSKEFIDFRVEAAGHGYGTPDAIYQRVENGGKQIVYENTPFRYDDNFIGGSPYMGYETVSCLVDDGYRPIWGMTYLELFKGDIGAGELQDVLGDVLTQRDEYLPVRGPKEWQSGDTTYFYREVDENRPSSMEQFNIEELIQHGGKTVYIARFAGGLANRDLELEATNPIWLET